MMPSTRRCLAALAMLSIASGCDERVETLPVYPSADDVQAAQEAKPELPLDLVTNEAAAARYDADVELAFDRVHDAAVRMCRSLKKAGAPYAFACGETSSERLERIAAEQE